MPNLSYIESLNNNRNRKKHSLFEWVKRDPQKHIQDIYEFKEPKEMLTRAERLRNWFYKGYPGDGVLFFFDDLLCPLSEVTPAYSSYSYPDEYNLLFNYLYSYRSDFTVRSRGALAVFLLNCPGLSVYLYRFRKKFDAQEWTDMIEKMRVFKSFNEYNEGDPARYITQFIWKTILEHQVPLSVCDNNIFMHLYYAYTHTAIQRFFFLANSRAALKEHIARAFSVYKETCLLLNCWRENAYWHRNENSRISKMSSIKAMERFHDLKSEEIIEEQRKRDLYQHTWENLSRKIREVSPEWYLPEFASDIRLRGQQHKNCVGGYIDRHFKTFEYNPKITYDYKMLLLFTDFCEAEVHVKFDEVIVEGKAYIGCVDVSIMQAKTAYNKDIKEEDFKELKKITRAFKNIPLEDFNPVVVEYKSESQ